MAVRDEWELLSCAAAVPGQVLRPPSPCVYNPTDPLKNADAITGDVKEFSRTVPGWLTRETHMFPVILT